MMDQELIIVARLSVADKFVAELGEAIQDLATASRIERGCLSYDVYQASGASGSFLIYEVWASDADWHKHRSASHITSFKSAVKALQATVSVERLRPRD
jgi:quinol monooxygenase YgiN